MYRPTCIFEQGWEEKRNKVQVNQQDDESNKAIPEAESRFIQAVAFRYTKGLENQHKQSDKQTDGNIQFPFIARLWVGLTQVLFYHGMMSTFFLCKLTEKFEIYKRVK